METTGLQLTALPTEALIAILSFCRVPDIGQAACVSTHLREVVRHNDGLWKEVAIARYSVRVTTATQKFYPTFQAMVRDDDNTRGGAVPTRTGLWKSSGRHSLAAAAAAVGRDGGLAALEPQGCCLVLAIQYDRARHEIRISVDARDPRLDVRGPETSGLWLCSLHTRRHQKLQRRSDINNNNDRRRTGAGANREEARPQLGARCTFIPHHDQPPDWRMSGRCKGVLCFDADYFWRPGKYQFCFANHFPSVERDYDYCTLFTIKRHGGLLDVFDSYSLATDSPFDQDSLGTDVEEARWMPHRPGGSLWQEAGPPSNVLGPWPECVGMSGAECIAYIRTQNPELQVSTQAYGPGVPLYYSNSTVRLRVSPRTGLVSRIPARG